MYLHELHIDGYGALQEVKLQINTPVTVIYGPNESGKSTLLRFVRSMLYGFPTRKDLVERGEPVFGGKHGGRLRLSDKSGREWILERYSERGSGLTIRDDSGMERTIGQNEWERLFLGGVSERLFRQLFAVSLNELHELRTLQGEDVGNYLYHSGLAGGTALTAARRQVTSEMDRLFRPKGATQEINKLLSEMKEIETAIRHNRDGVRYYQETGEELSHVEQQLASLEMTFPKLRLQTAKLQGAFELREWWLKREMLLAEETELRGQLVDPSMPLLSVETVSAWEGLKRQRSEATNRLAGVQSSVQELNLAREQLLWEEALVASYPEWERLESVREAIIAKRDERSELEAERRTLEETVQSTLSRLSVDWGEAELLAFGGLAAEREQVRKIQQAWEQAERTTVTLQAELRRLARQQEVLQAEERTAMGGSDALFGYDSPKGLTSPFGNFVPRTKAALLQAWHNSEDARRDYERARSSLRPSRMNMTRVRSGSEQSPAILLYVIAGLLGLAAIVLPFLLSGGGQYSTIYYGISVSLLLISIGLTFVGSRRKSGKVGRLGDPSDTLFMTNQVSDDHIASIRVHHRQMSERLRQLIHDPEAAATQLIPELSELESAEFMPLSETFDRVWQQLRDAVHEQIEWLEAMDRGKSKQQELQGRMQELQMECELVERDSIVQRTRMEELQENWQQWLHARKLPLHLTPDSLPELLGMAEQGQTMLRQRQRITERSQTLHRAIQEFEQAAIKLMEEYPPPVGMRQDAVVAVQWLHRESAKQLLAKAEASKLDRRLAEVELTLVAAQEALQDIENGIVALFQEAQVESALELEQRLRIDERCVTLRKEAREIQLRLESGRDLDEQAQLYELLRAYDEATLGSLLSEQQALLGIEEERRTDLLDKRGRLSQELEQQRSEAELEDKGQRLRELQSKLELLTERYAILAMTERLIVQTKAVYEEEKQPIVLQRASLYFHQMTNGAYTRIIAPTDSKSLFAETSDHRMVDSLFLSRGTQEQLYLAMRFALCDAASPEHPLPLLLDDLFVHFDEQRLMQTLPVLEKLGQARQVILFTCHRHVAQTIASGIPTAQMLTLGEN